MNEMNDHAWTDLDRALAERIRASVDGVRLPSGFSERLIPAFVARRKALRVHRCAAAAVVIVCAVAVALIAGASCRTCGERPERAQLLAGDSPLGDPGTELAAGWTVAGICRSLRRRRRDEDCFEVKQDSLQNPTKTP